MTNVRVIIFSYTTSALTTAFLLAFLDSHSSILFICTAGDVDEARATGDTTRSSFPGTLHLNHRELIYIITCRLTESLLVLVSEFSPKSSSKRSGEWTVILPSITCKRRYSDEATPIHSKKMNALSGLLQDSLISTGHVECCTIVKRSDGLVVATSVGYEVMVV